MNSDQLFEKANAYTPGGVHSPVRSFKGLHTTPRFMKKANGAFITDEEDNEYIDFCMSFGPLILGHKNPEVLSKARGALENGWSFGAAEKYSLELAQYIVDRIDHIDKILRNGSSDDCHPSCSRLYR